MEHLHVKFGGHGCIGFSDIVQKKRHANMGEKKKILPRDCLSAYVDNLLKFVKFEFLLVWARKQ